MSMQTIERPVELPSVDLEALFPGRLLSITSFTHDGTGVATPVWSVSDGRRLYAFTDLHSAKVRRIRRHPGVLVAPCRANGRLRRPPVPGRAEVLTATPDLEYVRSLLLDRYKLSYRLVMAFYRLGRRLKGRSEVADGAALAITVDPSAGAAVRRHAQRGTWATQLRWYAAAVVVGFVVPYVGSSLLELQHDLYLGIYFAIVLGVLGAYVRRTGLDLRPAFVRHWKLGVGLGLLMGFALVRNVLTGDGSPHPHGSYFAFELVWRGAIYGAVDALLLTVLPCTVVYRGLGGRLDSWRRRLAYLGASLALVVAITAAYHLGYAQYRQDGVRQPETGNVLISVPMLLSVNPVGSILDHAAMHVSAVAHDYETETRLPPPIEAK
jgi:PPOX class probable F420-dependent enzyme